MVTNENEGERRSTEDNTGTQRKTQENKGTHTHIGHHRKTKDPLMRGADSVCVRTLQDDYVRVAVGLS